MILFQRQQSYTSTFDPSEIDKNKKADIGIIGDVRVSLRAIIELCAAKGSAAQDRKMGKEVCRGQGELQERVED